MNRNKSLTLILLFLAMLSALPLLVRCTGARSGDETVSTQPTPIAGSGFVLDSINGRTRCGYTGTGVPSTYDVICHAVAIQTDGREAIATALAKGVSLQWQSPILLSGSPISAANCSVQSSGLTQNCQITLADSGSSFLKMPLQISDSGGTVTESDTVYLPFSIQTFGFVQELLSYAPLTIPGASNSVRAIPPGYQGFQTSSISTSSVNSLYPTTICFLNGVGYYASNNFVYALSQNNASKFSVSTYAGSANKNNTSELSHRLRVSFNNPRVYCSNKAIFVSDTGNDRVLKVPVIGKVEIVAGFGFRGLGGDGGLAIKANLNAPTGLAFDPNGAVYIADSGNRLVRKVDGTTGVISTVAGSLTGVNGDGGSATNAKLLSPSGITLDSNGNLYIADTSGSRIRKVDQKGIISTVAGTSYGSSGDGGPAINAQLTAPRDIVLGPDGNLYFSESASDVSDNRIRKVDLVTGVITTVAGTSGAGIQGDGGAATLTSLSGPDGLSFGPTGDLYVAEYLNNSIRRIDSKSGTISTAIRASVPTSNGDGGSAAGALFFGSAITSANDGSIYVAEGASGLIRKIDGATGGVKTIAGHANRQGCPGTGLSTDVCFSSTTALARGTDGSLYIHGHNSVRKVSEMGGLVTPFAGTGFGGYSGDGGAASEALIGTISAISVAPDNSAVYLLDQDYSVVRKVDATGTISTLAGTGTAGNLGDGGPANRAQLFQPSGMAFGPDGALYVGDTGNARLRRIDLSPTLSGGAATISGVTLVAASGNSSDLLGFQPTRVQFMRQDILVLDSNTNRVFRLVPNADRSIYTADVLFGETSAKDCGSKAISGSATSATLNQVLQTSLASICAGTLVDLSVQDQCSTPNGTLTLFLSQTFNISGATNLVKVTRSCAGI